MKFAANNSEEIIKFRLNPILSSKWSTKSSIICLAQVFRRNLIYGMIFHLKLIFQNKTNGDAFIKFVACKM